MLKQNKKAKKGKTNLLLFTVILLLILIYFPTTLWHFPDGIGYHSYLPAIFKYKNYDFLPLFSKYTKVIAVSTNGFIINDFSIGCAIIWLPVYLLSLIFDNQTTSLLFTNFFSSLLGILSLFISYKLLLYLNFSHNIALLSCILTFIGTPLLFYTYTIPQNYHTTCAFLISLFVMLWYSNYKKSFLEKYIFLGLLLGIICSVREQYIILSVFILCEFVLTLNEGKILKRMLLFLISFIVGLSPSLLNTKILFSKFTVPKMYTISTKFLLSNISEVLFSSYHSVILWTPLIIISTIGLIISIKEKYEIVVPSLIVIVLETIITSLVVSPGGGWSFGIRYYSDIVIILILGGAFLLKKIQNSKLHYLIKIFIFITSFWTFLLFILATKNIIDLIEVYTYKKFFSLVFKNLKQIILLSLEPRYIAQADEYFFLVTISIFSFFITKKITDLYKKNKNLLLYSLITICYIFIFNYKIFYAGFINRVVYKDYRNFVNFQDYKNYYLLAGIKVRLKYYKLTNNEDKYSYYHNLKNTIKPTSYFGKKSRLLDYIDYISQEVKQN